jgi:hypothetical protein
MRRYSCMELEGVRAKGIITESIHACVGLCGCEVLSVAIREECR